MTIKRISSILLRLHQIRYAVMAGLVPAIRVLHVMTMAGGYLYILASAPNGIL